VDIYAEAVLDAARSAKHQIAECPVVNVAHLDDGLKDSVVLIEGPFKHIHAVEEAQTVKLIPEESRVLAINIAHDGHVLSPPEAIRPAWHPFIVKILPGQNYISAGTNWKVSLSTVTVT
jgi:hypothetical protein